MDLLEYLIVPQTPPPISYHQPVSSPIGAQPLTSTPGSSTHINNTSPASSPPTPNGKKICFFHYHKGSCTRDASRNALTQGQKPCPYLHAVPRDAEPGSVKMKGMFVYHKKACGLPLCPWKEGVPLKTKKGEVETRSPVVGKMERGGEKSATVQETASGSASKKRNWMFHPDRPSFQAGKRTRMSYEDLYEQRPPSPPPSPPSPVNSATSAARASAKTCFFWYHGSCKRSFDARGCQMRHALADPPVMVEPPPGYVHRDPCELEWCPGDYEVWKVQRGERRRKDRLQGTRYFEGTVENGEGDGEEDDEDGKAGWFLGGFEFE